MNLPTITFLCGPSGVGKTTLANALFDALPNLQAHSLRAPLFGAARGAFFDCDPSLDLTFEPEKRNIPGLNVTVREWTNAFHLFLDPFVGTSNGSRSSPALGRLAAPFARSATEFFDKVIFDDGDRSLIDDIRFIAREFGEENCLIVNITRDDLNARAVGQPDTLRSDRIQCLTFKNSFSSPELMLDAFLALSPQPEPAK